MRYVSFPTRAMTGLLSYLFSPFVVSSAVHRLYTPACQEPPRDMRSALLACYLLVPAASAQVSPDWFGEARTWQDLSPPEASGAPEIVALADAGCPEAWPATLLTAEGEVIEAGSSMGLADMQWCDTNLLARDERELASLLNTLYASVSPDAMEAQGVPPERYAMTEPQRSLVAAQAAWLAYRDAACDFDTSRMFGWMGGAHVTVRCYVARTREWMDFVRQHQAAVDSGEFE